MITEVVLAIVRLIRRVSVVEVVFFLESHATGFQLLVGPLGGRGIIFEKFPFFQVNPPRIVLEVSLGGVALRVIMTVS